MFLLADRRIDRSTDPWDDRFGCSNVSRIAKIRLSREFTSIRHRLLGTFIMIAAQNR